MARIQHEAITPQREFEMTKHTTARFINADGGHTLQVKVFEGKSGWHVVASMKAKGGKNKPVNGARDKFKTEAEALTAAKKLGDEAVARGWTAVTSAVRTTFTAIPQAPKTAAEIAAELAAAAAPAGKKSKAA
jgi:hypothetical protein